MCVKQSSSVYLHGISYIGESVFRVLSALATPLPRNRFQAAGEWDTFRLLRVCVWLLLLSVGLGIKSEQHRRALRGVGLMQPSMEPAVPNWCCWTFYSQCLLLHAGAGLWTQSVLLRSRTASHRASLFPLVEIVHREETQWVVRVQGACVQVLGLYLY